MVRVLALVAQPIRLDATELLRMGFVAGCALALILVRQPLPLL